MTNLRTLHCLLLSTTLILGLGQFIASAANLLQNPGFATPPDPAKDWTLSLGASQGTPALSHDLDSYVLMFREDLTPINGWSSASQTLSAAPGQEWTFSGWAYYPSGLFLHDGDHALLDIAFTTASGTTTHVESPQVNLLLESTWQPLSQTAVAPPDTTQVTLSAMFYHNDVWATGRLYLDDFSAQSVPPIPEPPIVCVAWPLILLLMCLKRRGARNRA